MTEHPRQREHVPARAAGVDATRVYTDKLSGTSHAGGSVRGLPRSWTTQREGDAIVVVGIDRLGRNAAEVMATIRDLGERGIVLRSIREGIDTSNASGRMVAGVLASVWPSSNSNLVGERRTAARDARAGAWAIYWASEGAGSIESCAGAADAHER